MEKVLFTKQTLKNGVMIKNRFVKAAMNEAMGDKHFQPKKEVIRLYKTWSNGGTGLIITGNVMVDSNYLAEPGNIVFNEHADKELLKAWAKAGQMNETKIVVQINHPGKQAPKTVSKIPVAPSDIPIEGEIGKMFNPPRALTISEIKKIIQQFAVAAKVSQEAGFDGVEIHAAHGYLISQFLSPYDNRRTDEYGGNLDNRMRFLKEIYLVMREKVGESYPIGLKINSSDFKEGGFSEEDSLYVIQEMDALGIDFVEISGGSYENPKMSQEQKNNQVIFAEYSKKIKHLIQTPVIVTGGIRTVESMVELINDGFSDFIGLARPLALEPKLPNLIEAQHVSSIQTKRLTTGFKKLDKKVGSLIGLVYYQMLMQKIGQGKKTKTTTNAWKPLFHAVIHQGLAVLSPQRAKKEN